MLFASDRPGNFLLLFLKTVYQYLFTFASIFVFCIKQANKICTLLSSHLLALIVFSVQCFCFTKAYMFLVTHPDTNPAGEGLTLVNFSITKLSDAQRARLNLW